MQSYLPSLRRCLSSSASSSSSRFCQSIFSLVSAKRHASHTPSASMWSEGTLRSGLCLNSGYDAGRWFDITQRLQNTTFGGRPYFASSGWPGPRVESDMPRLRGLRKNAACEALVDGETRRSAALRVKLAREQRASLQRGTELDLPVTGDREHIARVGRLHVERMHEVHEFARTQRRERRRLPGCVRRCEHAVPTD